MLLLLLLLLVELLLTLVVRWPAWFRRIYDDDVKVDIHFTTGPPGDRLQVKLRNGLRCRKL